MDAEAVDGFIEQDVRARLLVADDNSVNQRVAQGGAFELMLMDVQMPDMDEFEATAAIRDWERASGQHVPIVAMTAHAMPGDNERCLAAGMDGYLSKPIEQRSLYAVVEE